MITSKSYILHRERSSQLIIPYHTNTMHLQLTFMITALAATLPVTQAAPPDRATVTVADTKPTDTTDRTFDYDVNIGLYSSPGYQYNVPVGVQHQCVNLERKKYPEGLVSVEIPEEYRCRFWTGRWCHGGGTGDINGPGGEIEEKYRKKLNSFKCYAGTKKVEPENGDDDKKKNDH
ncbi:hypothetical protein BDW74DRAFT_121096 [Aspergillus multicolor]|uniref:uncharacterized protein n=1 Tax=Aspergillus multicolor TaxID=41759 RepID=UPI003CCD01F6